MRVAIAGSSGLIGSALTERLRMRGHQVIEMHRGHRDDPHAVWNPAEGWIRDGALDDIDALVNLGGATIGERWNDAHKQLLVSSRVDATRLLVRHLHANNIRPQVLVSGSAAGYYGDRGEEPLTEASSPGDDFLARLCVDWEAEATRAADLGTRVVLTRQAFVVDRDAEAFRRFVLPIRFGAGGRLGSGAQWFPWVHLDDTLRAIELSLHDEGLSGPVNLVAPGSTTNAQFTREVGHVLGRPTLMRVPPIALRTLLGQMTDALLLGSQRISPDVLEGRGYIWRYPTAEAAIREAAGARSDEGA